MSTLEDQVRATLDADRQAPAIEFRGIWYRWGEMRAVADAVGALLNQAGAEQRAAIGFVPRNRPSAIAAELGMAAAGRTIRMIYAFQSAGGIAREVARLKLGAVVAAAEDFTPELRAVLVDHGIAGIALTEMNAAPVAGAERSTAPLDPDAPRQPEIQVHTSGTTGPPKHVGFSYDMIARHIVGQNVAAVTGETTQAPPVLLTFPLGNISGIYSVFPPMLARRRAVLLDRFTLDGWRDYISRYRPAVPMLPPAAVGMVLDAAVAVEELSCIRMILTGAAPLDPIIQQAFEERYGIPILLSYGATEFGGPVTVMTPDLYAQFGSAKRGTVGRPFAGARLRAIDGETGDVLLPGGEGVLEVVAPRIGDHWIRTTDIGMVDADGFVFLRGRADGAIVRGGFKLLPETIEAALLTHPAVAAAAIVGMPDPRLGHVPAAAVQVAPGTTRPAIADLERHLREQVYATHIPTRWAFVETLPRNASMKTDIPAIRALFAD